MRIGLISDTHGLLRPEALQALAGSDRIVHAGDIGDAAILESLAAIAPVTAVRGNNDQGTWAQALPHTALLVEGGVRILVIHDVKELSGVVDAQVVIAGHSHQPKVERREGVLFVNPGSAGPRRFKLPVCVGRLIVQRGRAEAELMPLAV
ncbi:MAG TPA: metallophosphoesterase family protein [Albitalea sp.]|uniref:metallophosphoesterase family protein n=1 Tax=Piscinibacter sp. TaxID=1903157 RepID=UPI002ED0E0CE